jgi:tetratricopeptide (TPR) repeat protein
MSNAIRLQPDNRDYLRFRGMMYSLENLHESAIADFSHLIKLDPENSDAYRYRGIEYALKGDYVESERDLKKAIDLAPSDARNYSSRLKIFFAQQRYSDALRDSDKAISLDGTNPVYLRQRVEIYQRIGDYDRGIADCNRLIALDPQGIDGYKLRVGVDQEKGDIKSTIADLSEIIKRSPHDITAYYLRASEEFGLRRWAAARNDYAEFARLDGGDADSCDEAAWHLSTSTHSELRDGKAAVLLATRACKLSGGRNSAYLDTLAAAYAEAGDFASAIKWENEAIRVGEISDPENVRWIRARLEYYQHGYPYREGAEGGQPFRPTGSRIAAMIAALLALIGLGTVIFVCARLIRGARKATLQTP